MKTKKLGKKLSLNKTTVTNLDIQALDAIRGGTDLSCVIQCPETENPYISECAPSCDTCDTCYSCYICTSRPCPPTTGGTGATD